MSMREVICTATLAGVLILSILGAALYSGHENRQAYYKCLEVTEKVIHMRETTKATGVEIVSLPFCRI